MFLPFRNIDRQTTRQKGDCCRCPILSSPICQMLSCHPPHPPRSHSLRHIFSLELFETSTSPPVPSHSLWLHEATPGQGEVAGAAAGTRAAGSHCAAGGASARPGASGMSCIAREDGEPSLKWRRAPVLEVHSAKVKYPRIALKHEAINNNVGVM